MTVSPLSRLRFNDVLLSPTSWAASHPFHQFLQGAVFGKPNLFSCPPTSYDVLDKGSSHLPEGHREGSLLG